jgi:DUF1009 family protein
LQFEPIHYSRNSAFDGFAPEGGPPGPERDLGCAAGGVKEGMGEHETRLSPRPRFSGRVGLLAGSGRFPFLFTRAAQDRGMEVVCVGIAGHADPGLSKAADQFFWNGVARLGAMIRRFKRERIECVVMAGKIQKRRLYDRWRLLRHMPDLRFVRAFWSGRRRDNRDDAILLSLVSEFERDGIRVASALEVCPELLASAGRLTKRGPSDRELEDLRFGWRIAKEMGRLDVGQSVAVRERSILAVEAVEGTDAMIERAGGLCPSGGFTVVKVAKPSQDMRFDVPAVGRNTIEAMRAVGATCLAIEAGKTIVIELEETVRLADRCGVSIVSLSTEEAVGARSAAG